MKRVLSYISLPLFLTVCLFGCRSAEQGNPPSSPSPSRPKPISYLALGDSYTIGESVEENLRWPVQLVRQLNTNPEINFSATDIIARTGWTTGELASAIAKENPTNDYELVSLLIGVNNQFRGYNFTIYEEEFVELLDTAIEKAGGRGDKVFVVSIPDYGVTPFGQNRNPEKIAKEIDDYNNYARGVCADRGIPFFNITPISRAAINNPVLIANDGLHPSGEMYRMWVELIQDSVENLVLRD